MLDQALIARVVSRRLLSLPLLGRSTVVVAVTCIE